MNKTYKSASIENTSDEGPGTFRVILSAPTEDRDGDTLTADTWKMPLPDHINFDVDHSRSVEKTVGSGVPTIDADTGNLIVDGTYSSLPLGQSVRSLVNEGHIRTTSVAFMTVPAGEKALGKTVRELLNGAFVAVPSNREAVVLESKSLEQKAGARNAAADLEKIQQIHDLTIELGATSDGATKSVRRGRTIKALAGSMELTLERIRDELQEANPGSWVWLRGTVPNDTGDGGYVVYELENTDTWESETYRQSYTNDGTVIALLDDQAVVELSEVVTQEPPEAPLPTVGAGTDDLPPAVAGDKSLARADQDSDDFGIRAARYRALIATNTDTPRKE